MTHRYQLPHHQILLTKPLFPPPQRLHLLTSQILQFIQRPFQILGEHIFIEAPARETSARIPTREILVGSAWSVEVSPGGDVENPSAHSEIDGHVILPAVGEELWGSEDFEDGGRGWFGEGCCGRLGGPEAHVEEDCEEGEEDEVDGGVDGGSRGALEIR